LSIERKAVRLRLEKEIARPKISSRAYDGALIGEKVRGLLYRVPEKIKDFWGGRRVSQKGGGGIRRDGRGTWERKVMSGGRPIRGRGGWLRGEVLRCV